MMGRKEKAIPPEYDERYQNQVDEEIIEEEDEVMGMLAASFPWVVSLMVHLAVFLLLLFIIMMEIPPEEDPLDYVPGASPKQLVAATQFVTPRKRVQKETISSSNPIVEPTKQPISVSSEKSKEVLDVTGIGGPSTGSAGAGGLKGVGIGNGTSFFDSGSGNASNIVYVVDRSGSMIDTFDFLRGEMIRSIHMLNKDTNYHLVFFADGDPVEMSRKRLVPATRLNRKASVKFLKERIIPTGSTNPVPAIRRAFDVLRNTKKKGWLIYLLTDGAFNDSDAVLKTIENCNADGRVRIHTFLYGHRPPEAVKVMKQIADQNGGSYRFIANE